MEEILVALGFEEHIESFHTNGITDESFFTLTNTDLKELGLENLGDRKKVLSAIENHWKTIHASKTNTANIATTHESTKWALIYAALLVIVPSAVFLGGFVINSLDVLPGELGCFFILFTVFASSVLACVFIFLLIQEIRKILSSKKS